MDDGSPFAALPLPLVHLGEQVEESLLGVGDVTIGRPAQELELTHHQLALLELAGEKGGGRGEGGTVKNAKLFACFFRGKLSALHYSSGVAVKGPCLNNSPGCAAARGSAGSARRLGDIRARPCEWRLELHVRTGPCVFITS